MGVVGGWRGALIVGGCGCVGAGGIPCCSSQQKFVMYDRFRDASCARGMVVVVRRVARLFAAAMRVVCGRWLCVSVWQLIGLYLLAYVSTRHRWLLYLSQQPVLCCDVRLIGGGRHIVTDPTVCSAV